MNHMCHNNDPFCLDQINPTAISSPSGNLFGVIYGNGVIETKIWPKNEMKMKCGKCNMHEWFIKILKVTTRHVISMNKNPRNCSSAFSMYVFSLKLWLMRNISSLPEKPINTQNNLPLMSLVICPLKVSMQGLSIVFCLTAHPAPRPRRRTLPSGRSCRACSPESPLCCGGRLPWSHRLRGEDREGQKERGKKKGEELIHRIVWVVLANDHIHNTVYIFAVVEKYSDPLKILLYK